MNRSDARYGMILDRGLTFEQLDLAYHLAVADPDPRTNRRRLTISLRDLVNDQEAQGKTKKCLTRVWLNPPAAAAEMIAWARANGQTIEPRVLHMGALLATFPFVGVVAKVIGQHLQTESQIEAPRAREEVRRILGDRSSVDVGARKAYTTLCNLGLLQRVGRTLMPMNELIVVSDPLVVAWLSNAVLLTRQVESQPVSSLRSAPELLGATMVAVASTAYPLLETHANGGERVVAATRSAVGAAAIS
ncbi:MAG: hypothetical protein AB1925_29980 [Actinomycetota bacterium]